MKFEFDWVDAFSDRPFGGNGCAVVHDAAHLDVETCTNLVRETSLVECTFTGPSEVADVHVRYFLASREIPFAGHPTLATVAAMKARGLACDGSLTLQTGSGIIPVSLKGNRITMRQNAPEFGAVLDPGIVAEAVGLEASDIVGPAQIVSTGLPFCIVVLASRDALDKAVLSPDGMKRFRDASGVGEADIMEPFMVVREGADANGDTFARLLLLPPNPAEDPFTGSATGAMAAHLWRNGLLERPRFVAHQGHGMGRPGQASVEVLGPRDAIEGVLVGGQGYVLMSGNLNL